MWQSLPWLSPISIPKCFPDSYISCYDMMHTNPDRTIISTLGLTLVNGFGGLLVFYTLQYTVEGKDYSDITNLMTMPTLLDVPVAASLSGNNGETGKKEAVIIATQRVPSDFENSPRRTWKLDMRLWTEEPNWSQAWRVLQVRLINHMLLLLLSRQISMLLFSQILLVPPAQWTYPGYAYRHWHTLQLNCHCNTI
ncbi:hypothetical protein BJY00DRAFT_290304 [Aspergillus carlsbadensis]|nr:hypothetical protein BJY00DRAFT_290304 [Aspergillus carlsbadensis]